MKIFFPSIFFNIPFPSFRYVENGSLQKTIEAFGELPEELVASYVVKILEGLSYLHRQNVVHCDLKAANILSTKTGNIKLADFGVSLNLNAVQTIAKDAYEANGTPYWSKLVSSFILFRCYSSNRSFPFLY